MCWCCRGRAKRENDTFSLDELLENLKIELKSRERCDNSAGIHLQAPRHQRHHGSVPPTAASLTTTAKLQPVSCVFCSDGYASAHCTVITNTAKRREVLSREGRCFCVSENITPLAAVDHARVVERAMGGTTKPFVSAVKQPAQQGPAAIQQKQ